MDWWGKIKTQSSLKDDNEVNSLILQYISKLLSSYSNSKYEADVEKKTMQVTKNGDYGKAVVIVTDELPVKGTGKSCSGSACQQAEDAANLC